MQELSSLGRSAILRVGFYSRRPETERISKERGKEVKRQEDGGEKVQRRVGDEEEDGTSY